MAKTARKAETAPAPSEEDRQARKEEAVADTQQAKALAAGETEAGAPETRRVPEHPGEPKPLGSSTQPEDMPT